MLVPKSFYSFGGLILIFFFFFFLVGWWGGGVGMETQNFNKIAMLNKKDTDVSKLRMEKI